MTDEQQMSRRPPVGVRRQLRREAGFVCAHPDCVEPYLEYHHFDPPWHIENHHRPDGLIALCPLHHARADAWPASDLREWKQRGAKPMQVAHKVEWRRDQTVFVVGGTVIKGCSVVLKFGDDRVIWVTEDESGRSLFNFCIRGIQGQEAFVMQDNDWIAHPGWDDIEIGVEGRSLHFRAEKLGIRLRLHFSECTIGDLLERRFQALVRGAIATGASRASAESAQASARPSIKLAHFSGFQSLSETTLVCSVTGELASVGGLKMTHDACRYGTLTISGGLLSRGDTALSLG
jgi:hypothetical protein